jgi:hypothetical protein
MANREHWGGSPGNAAHALPRWDPAPLRSRNCEAEYMHNQLTINEAESAALDTLGVAQYPCHPLNHGPGLIGGTVSIGGFGEARR